MPDRYSERSNPDHFEQEDSLALSHFVRTVGDYRWPILIGFLAVILGYAIGAVATYLVMPARKITFMKFRLDFEGADRGRYPNGLKFSPAEVTSMPVLTKVYQKNDLAPFMSLQTFSRSVFLLESNRELELLSAEYQTKLSDPKLTPVDRDRFEKEFELKRNSISKADYAIGIMEKTGLRQLPVPLRKKVLSDTLVEWAGQAAAEKRALDYRIPVLTTNLLEGVSPVGRDYTVALIMLRNKVTQVLQNIETIAKMPGADLVRTAKRGSSLGEGRLELEDLIRFRIDPLLLAIHSKGLVADHAGLMDVLRAQVAFDERRLSAAQMREAALMNALAAYERDKPAPERPDVRRTADAPPTQGGETVMPQISEGFLERVVALANSSADREYRQKLVNNITDASLLTIPAEASLNYHKNLLQIFGSGSRPKADAAAAAAVKTEMEDTFATVNRVVNEVHEIYTTASRQLNPASELYTALGPPSTRLERGVSMRKLVLGALLVTLFSIPALIIGAMIHNRFRAEERLEHSVYVPSAGSDALRTQVR